MPDNHQHLSTMETIVNFAYQNGQLAIIVVMAACLLACAIFCIYKGSKVSRKQSEVNDLTRELKYTEAKYSEIGNLLNKRGEQLKELNDQLLTLQSTVAAKDERIAELMAIIDKQNRLKDAEVSRYWSLDLAGKGSGYHTPEAYISAARQINRYLRQAK